MRESGRALIFGTNLRSLVAVAFLFGCQQPQKVEIPVPTDEPLSFINLRGRVSAAELKTDIPSPVRDFRFSVGTFPATFVAVDGAWVPQFEVRQKSHAAWSGHADAQYVFARANTLRTPEISDRIEELESAGLDPIAMNDYRKVRSAIAKSPSQEEFFSPPIERVLIVESKDDVVDWRVPGGTQILLRDEAEDWIRALQGVVEVGYPMLVTESFVRTRVTKDSAD